MNRSVPSYPTTGMQTAAGARQAIKAVPQLDLERFAGRWHEIARLPSPLQRAADRKVTLAFTHAGKGGLCLRLLARQGDGTDRGAEALLRRRFAVEEPGQFERSTAPSWLRWLPSAWQPLWVLAVDRDYRWTMLGEPARRGLWILARDATMERSLLETLKGRARGLGYDLAPLILSGELRSYLPL